MALIQSGPAAAGGGGGNPALPRIGSRTFRICDQDDKVSRYPCELRLVGSGAQRSVRQRGAPLRAWVERAALERFIAGAVLFAAGLVYLFQYVKYKRIIRVIAALLCDSLRGACFVFQTKFPSLIVPLLERSAASLCRSIRRGSIWLRVGMGGVSAAPGAGIA